VFDRVTIRVSDRAASERFYLTVLRALGIEQTHSDAEFAESPRRSASTRRSLRTPGCASAANNVEVVNHHRP
jgi:catechol 2,3-dioxygenase-like lactoylglutathione lyase family enzyme